MTLIIYPSPCRERETAVLNDVVFTFDIQYRWRLVRVSIFRLESYDLVLSKILYFAKAENKAQSQVLHEKKGASCLKSGFRLT